MVVEEQSGFGTFKIKQIAKLALDTGDVFLQLIERQQIAFFALAARIANHAGRSADEGDWPMPGFLKTAKRQGGQQRADVQAVAGRIEAAVERPLPTGQPAAELFGMGGLVDEAAPGEVGEEVHAGSQESGVRSQMETI